MVKSGYFYGIQEPYFTLESKSQNKRVDFGVLQERLIRFINERIQNGDFTERGLARILGVSQPQIHHILKGARKLRPEIADRVIAKFDISILDLLQSAELQEQLDLRLAQNVGATPTFEAIGSHVAPKRFSAELALRKPPGSEKAPSPVQQHRVTWA